jgi:hypothetical protein
MKLDADEMIADARAASKYLRGPPRRDGQGRRDGLLHRRPHDLSHRVRDRRRARRELLRRRDRRAARSGGKPSTVGRTGKIKGRILCLFGEKDGMIRARRSTRSAPRSRRRAPITR